MATMTLLEVVQSVLNSMDSDSVNTVSETVESDQVADVVKEVYYDLISHIDMPNLWKFRELNGLGDSTQPTTLSVPSTVLEVRDLRYDVSKSTDTYKTMRDLIYMDPDKFLDLLYGRRTDDADITEYTAPNGASLFIHTDQAPTYWTSFNDSTVVCDSYDADDDSTLQASKTVAWCYEEPTWTKSDTFTPTLPLGMFSMFLARCKEVCHQYFKQQASPVDSQVARRGMIRQRRLSKLERPDFKPNYGRK